MERLSPRRKVRFSMLFLAVLITGICSWLAGYRYGYRSASGHRKDLVERSARLIDSLSAEKSTAYHELYSVAKIVAHGGKIEDTKPEMDNLALDLSRFLDEHLEGEERQQVLVNPYYANLAFVVSAEEEGHHLIERFLRAKRLESAVDVQTDGDQGSR